MKDSEATRVYLRIMDFDDGTPEGAVKIKMVANPPHSEWDPDNLSQAQLVALCAINAMKDLHNASKELEEDVPAPVVNAPAPQGNN